MRFLLLGAGVRRLGVRASWRAAVEDGCFVKIVNILLFVCLRDLLQRCSSFCERARADSRRLAVERSHSDAVSLLERRQPSLREHERLEAIVVGRRLCDQTCAHLRRFCSNGGLSETGRRSLSHVSTQRTNSYSRGVLETLRLVFCHG